MTTKNKKNDDVYAPNQNTVMAKTSFNVVNIKKEMVEHFKSVLDYNTDDKVNRFPTFSKSHAAMACVFDEICNFMGTKVKPIASKLSDGRYNVTSETLLGISKDIDCVFRFDMFTGMTFNSKQNYAKAKCLSTEDIYRAFTKFHPDIKLSNSGAQWMMYFCGKIFSTIISYCDTIRLYARTQTIDDKLVTVSLKLLLDDSQLFEQIRARIVSVMKVFKPDKEETEEVQEEEKEEAEQEQDTKSVSKKGSPKKGSKKKEESDDEVDSKKSSKKTSKKDEQDSDNDVAPSKKTSKKVDKKVSKKDSDEDQDSDNDVAPSKKASKKQDSDDDVAPSKKASKKVDKKEKQDSDDDNAPEAEAEAEPPKKTKKETTVKKTTTKTTKATNTKQKN